MNKRVDPPQAERAGRALRVTMLGIRGFPDVQGGVEKHAENLACALVRLGCEVEAIVRSSYVAKEKGAIWRGVRLARIWAPRMTGVEAFAHTFLGVVYAGLRRPDILHIHAIGPAFFAPLARALGLNVVVTFHSRNYEHKKWGRFARLLLRLGERAGMKFADGRIAVSEGLAKQLTNTYRRPVVTIPNGIDKPHMAVTSETLRAFGLTPNRYALMVARIDEDKRQLDLIEAYARLHPADWKLALVGAADYAGSYARDVADAARKTPGVVMLGHQSGVALAELYTHAGLFVLPSRFEGQPIAVLEAASYGLPVILSDIAAHREIALPRARYFNVGDLPALAEHLAAMFAAPVIEKSAAHERARLLARHDWDAIAQRTLAIYCAALSGTKSGLAGEPAVKIKELS